MTRFVAFEKTEFQRVAEHGFDSHVFFGSRKYSGPGPQIYMNNVDPGITLAAHFHRIDQFQVFFGTEGACFQRKPIPSVFVHYADAFRTYGPFSAAADASLLYATIRAESDNYGGVMPGARDERPYLGQRHLSADVGGWEAPSRPAAGAAETVEVFPAAADGLAASLVRLGANAAWTTPDAAATSGRALCVLDGELRSVLDGDPSSLPDGDLRSVLDGDPRSVLDGDPRSVLDGDPRSGEGVYGPRTVGWQACTDPATVLQAGPDGCALLTLDFPRPASNTVH